jgi:hypothetical protein
MTIEFNDGSEAKKILDFVVSTKFKGRAYITLDSDDSYYRRDIIFDKPLRFRNTKYMPVDNQRGQHILLSTDCDKEAISNFVRLLSAISEIGDGGHSFSVRFMYNEDHTKTFYWDGDGADRIERINNIQRKHKATWQSRIIDILRAEELPKEELDESIKLQKLIENISRKVIKEYLK